MEMIKVIGIDPAPASTGLVVVEYPLSDIDASIMPDPKYIKSMSIYKGSEGLQGYSTVRRISEMNSMIDDIVFDVNDECEAYQGIIAIEEPMVTVVKNPVTWGLQRDFNALLLYRLMRDVKSSINIVTINQGKAKRAIGLSPRSRKIEVIPQLKDYNIIMDEWLGKHTKRTAEDCADAYAIAFAMIKDLGSVGGINE